MLQCGGVYDPGHMVDSYSMISHDIAITELSSSPSSFVLAMPLISFIRYFFKTFQKSDKEIRLEGDPSQRRTLELPLYNCSLSIPTKLKPHFSSSIPFEPHWF